MAAEAAAKRKKHTPTDISIHTRDRTRPTSTHHDVARLRYKGLAYIASCRVSVSYYEASICVYCTPSWDADR